MSTIIKMSSAGLAFSGSFYYPDVDRLMSRAKDIQLSVRFEDIGGVSARSLAVALAQTLSPEIFCANEEVAEALAEAKSVLDEGIPAATGEMAKDARLKRIAELEKELATLRGDQTAK